MDNVITIKELNDCLDMIFKNKDNDNVIFIDKDMKKELCRTYKLLFDYSKLLEKRIDKAIEYIEKNTEYLDIEKGEVFECMGAKNNRVPIISVSGLLKILRGENNE